MFQYKTLSELTTIDYPKLGLPRFKMVYSLLSPLYTARCTLSLFVSERQYVPSVTSVFPGSGWQEREVWDLFGIYFLGNTDLRRILTDYGFRGYPLRKDFPLTGFLEIFYDDKKKQTVYAPVSLAQEFRNFLSPNPWRSSR